MQSLCKKQCPDDKRIKTFLLDDSEMKLLTKTKQVLVFLNILFTHNQQVLKGSTKYLSLSLSCFRLQTLFKAKTKYILSENTDPIRPIILEHGKVVMALKVWRKQVFKDTSNINGQIQLKTEVTESQLHTTFLSLTLNKDKTAAAILCHLKYVAQKSKLCLSN